jgi:hypothetical protein
MAEEVKNSNEKVKNSNEQPDHIADSDKKVSISCDHENDLISRTAALDALRTCYDTETITYTNGDEYISYDQALAEIEELPSAEQQEKVIYSTMSDKEFEEWLRAHGICHPDIREPIPCSAVPLLIDDAINELPPAEPEIIRCKDCKFWRTYAYIKGKPKFLPKCGFNQIYVNGEDFCSRAERRPDGMDS